MMKKWILVLTAVVFMVACGSHSKNDHGFSTVTCSSTGDIKMSCAWSWQCQSLGSTSTSYEASFQASCSSSNGIFAAGACPAAGRIGGCVTGYELIWYYSTPDVPLTVDNIIVGCATLDGTYCQ
jgi:hypothetical protein